MEDILKRKCKSFEKNGYTCFESLFTEYEVEEMKTELANLVNQYSLNDCFHIFITGEKQRSDEYFLESNNKIRYFVENDAWNAQLNKWNVPKEHCLNKIGHALHCLNPLFKRITFDQRIKSIAKEIGLIDPVVVQSMIILKNPRIGSQVDEHQDATFLYSTPQPRVVGFWIPLENAIETNGCLQFVAGSHKTIPLLKRWVRKREPDGSVCMVHADQKDIQLQDFDYSSLPASKGSCVLIDGLVVHRSGANRSTFPRPVYTFHVFDRHQRQWDPLNWLQNDGQFLPLLPDDAN